MSEKRYIHIRNWDRFQHYKNRDRVTWIKDYVAQLHDSDYMNLTLRQCGLLHRLRLEYASSGQRGIADDTASVYRAVGERVFRKDLEALNHAGLVVISSRRSLEDVYTREEKEVEEDKDPSVQPVARPPENGRTDGTAIAFDYQNILQDMPA